MLKILYNSSQIRKEITRLFSAPRCRRVAIVAFVGDGAESYLPKPKGLHLICWPKAGGTNPNAIRQLIKRNVKVSFVDSLHMKVYWAEGRGAIITSANLSTNALGSGDLKEVGVLLSDEDLDIDYLISSLKLRNPSKKELSNLDRLHDLFYVKNPPMRKKRHVPTFKTWYQSIAPRLWKLGWADERGTFSRSAKEIAKQDYGLSPYWFVACKKNDFRKEDWVLTFMLQNNAATELAWMFVDYIVPVAKNDKRAYSSEYPFQAVQVGKRSRYPIPPFGIDTVFRKAFTKAIKEIGGSERVEALKSMKPPKTLVKLIANTTLKRSSI